MRKFHYFYPRPPRGGRPDTLKRAQWGQMISIHALREEGDLRSFPLPNTHNISIHALREEGDMFHGTSPCSDSISIHALREEGDLTLTTAAICR